MIEAGRDELTHQGQFTNFTFPRFVLRSPEIYFQVLRSEDGTRAVKELWDALGEDIVAAGAGHPIPSTAVTATLVDRRTMEGAIVVFPPPTSVPDCHMIAVVRPRLRRWLGFIVGPKPGYLTSEDRRPRYFTLERSENLFSGDVGSTLGEWTLTAHLNYGHCAGASYDSFLNAIEDILAAKRVPKAAYLTRRCQSPDPKDVPGTGP